MFDKKKQKVFDAYVKYIEKRGSKFDFIKSAKSFEDFLGKVGVRMKASEYFREVWDELDDIKSRWEVDEDSLNTFLDAMPKEILKRNLTENILQRKIKPADQPKYEQMVASMKHQARASFLNTLPSSVTVAKTSKGVCTVSTYLGDLTDKVGLPSKFNSGKLYKDFYDSLEKEIGKEKCAKAIADMVPDVVFEVVDWPNVTNMDNAVYEIEFYLDPDQDLLEDLEAAVTYAVEDFFD